MRKLFLILVLVLATFTGCRKSHVSDDFKLNSTLRMEIKGYITFLYDPLTCQISYNPDKYEFRVHSDNMSDFYIIRLDEMPAAEGQTVNGTASWTTGDDLHTKKTSFEVIHLEGGKIWLWSPGTRIAAVVMELE